MTELIVIEGSDGAGTTTLAKGLTTYFGDKATFSHEPTQGPIGLHLRKILSGQEPGITNPKMTALLFAADRLHHWSFLLQEARQTKDFIFVDRHILSTLAYQANTPEDFDWLYTINQYAPVPKKMIYLDVTPEESLRRIASRPSQDLYETETKLRLVSSMYESALVFLKTKLPELEILRINTCISSKEETLNLAISFLDDDLHD
jgi:dTMP kinase